MKTKVIFRKWRDTGDIIALFPQDPGDASPYTCSSFMHVGQHSSADPAYLIRERTVAAKPAEYRELAHELRAAPYLYQLDIRQRIGRADLEIRRKQLREME